MIRCMYKDTFAVIGKMGQGTAVNPEIWVDPLWEAAKSNIKEVESLVRKGENGTPLFWGAYNDMAESNKRWGEDGMSDTGKFMAGCEADPDAIPLEGWSKWIIPAQTYLVAPCTVDDGVKVYTDIADKFGDRIVGNFHEFYPDPSNPNALEFYIPIATGMTFCQSCGMPLAKPEDFSKEADGKPSPDYCQHCYPNGTFANDGETMEEMIELCIPHCRDYYESDEAARADMMEKFPHLKRWAKR